MTSPASETGDFLQEREERCTVHSAGELCKDQSHLPFSDSGSWAQVWAVPTRGTTRRGPPSSNLPGSQSTGYGRPSILRGLSFSDGSEPVRTKRDQSFPPKQDPCLI
ncbi:rCG43755 [Rattus norvegicus]|uniref:RCG43755 n=1 Tax=Rattus norvegicus TaxID=10116 RepID=A6KUU3_RAT|nr:rCG43755 [Rattus norvegicus]